MSGHHGNGMADSPFSSVITDAACVVLFETKVIVVRMNGDVVEHNIKVPVEAPKYIDRMARTTPRQRSRIPRPGDQSVEETELPADDYFQPGDS